MDTWHSNFGLFIIVFRSSVSLIYFQHFFFLIYFQGKFIRINFDVTGYIVGANIETCILFHNCIIQNRELISSSCSLVAILCDASSISQMIKLKPREIVTCLDTFNHWIWTPKWYFVVVTLGHDLVTWLGKWRVPLRWEHLYRQMDPGSVCVLIAHLDE